MKRYARNKGAVAGLAIVGLVILVALLAGFAFPQSPWNSVAEPLLDPLSDMAHLLGTDMLGRDIAAGLAHGARVSLLVGVVSTAVATLIGITIGALAGYHGGRLDDALMRLTEFFQTIPTLAMAVVLVAIFQPTITSIITAIAVVSWPPVAR
ncbi:ABC transporter permease, partial [Verminephrobacter sp. Larva24]